MEKNGLGVRKGAWTKEEDILLKKCIEKFGEGKWHTVPHRAGLNRCRKSCRLRWLNYLRPNLKRGYFTNDEVDLIQRLHKLLGNRWSLIAGRLPGRTANDVKNFRNSHILKKSSSSFARERRGKTTDIKTFTEKNIKIKPQPRKKNPSSQQADQPDDRKNSVEFSLINSVSFPLPEELDEVDECIRWWLQTEGDGDEPTRVTFFNKDDGDGTFVKPAFSPKKVFQIKGYGI